MKLSSLKKFLALIALAAVAACGGSSGSGSSIPSSANPGPPQGSPLARIVGVGDSLTAGYQSNGFLGATGLKNPFFPGEQVPPNQPNGFWALLDEQASGKSIDKAVTDMYDPAVSPLPLIAKPGLNNQIVPDDNGFFPLAALKTGDTCTIDGGFNLAGYRLRGMQRVRMNPRSNSIRDLGVPGLTMHEANTLKAPQTSTCKPLPGIPGLLNLIIAQESGTFWPVLGNFTYLGPHLTEVNAAASKHPTLATVWLGANDVLKYMGSGGRFTGGNHNAAQAAADIRATVSTLQHAGARVVVANLPNIVETGFFQSVTRPKKLSDCRIRTYADCIFRIAAIPGYVLPQLAKKYHLDTPQGCVPTSVTQPCGYLTLPGAVAVIQTFAASGVVPNLDCSTPAPGCKGAPGNGQGMNYITPAFAGKIQALNEAINTGIDNGAQASNVPLVDVQAIFHGLASGDPANPYFAQAAAINPGLCCTLGYLWGITSFDGLHPSNTGYALIANAFIQTINAAYGTHIPEVNVRAVYAGTRCSNPSYCFPDPYAPPNDAPYKP